MARSSVILSANLTTLSTVNKSVRPHSAGYASQNPTTFWHGRVCANLELFVDSGLAAAKIADCSNRCIKERNVTRHGLKTDLRETPDYQPEETTR